MENTKRYDLKITRDSLNSQIAGVLVDSILNGDIPAGAALRQIELAEQFKTSQSPIREALLMLERIGLVRMEPNKGAYVIEISDDEAVELLLLRGLYECRSIFQYAETCGDEQQEAMDRHLQEMDRALGKQDMASFMDSDMGFHDLICRQANPLIYNQWKVINMKIRLMMASMNRELTWDDLSNVARSHHVVAGHLQAGEVELAVEANQKHLFDVWQILYPEILRRCHGRMKEFGCWQQTSLEILGSLHGSE